MKSLFYKLYYVSMPLYVLRGVLHLGYRHLRYSGLMGYGSENRSVGKLIASYHSIEKGLTMPDFRPGFGEGAINSLIAHCNTFIDSYNSTNTHLLHSVQVILEYQQLHHELGYDLSEELLGSIASLKAKMRLDLASAMQNTTTADQFFSRSHSSFPEFVTSRASIRNFDQRLVPSDVILQAVELAKSAPSACNRQSVRVHYLQNPSIITQVLAIQAGSRGFSHKVSNLLILTTDIGAYFGPNELTIGWVDGGMFAMNLCLSLHYLKVATCPLNCSLSVEKQRSLRRLLPIPENESFVVMLAVGYPPAEFKYTASKRYDSDEIFVFHQ
ncbi:MAG: nitroreductase family protein [Cyanobacteriota bacterium]